MSKLGYIVVFLCGVMLFNSCSNRMEVRQSQRPASIHPAQLKKSYGAYVAGRVAHLRKNFNKAADYYIEALKDDPENAELINSVYLLLVSKGRVHEAAKYARISQSNGDKNNFIYIILMTDDMKEGRYAEAEKDLSGLKGPVYDQFIVPLLSAWSYVGRPGDAEANRQKALQKLAVVAKEPSFRALYNFHAGMINDYYGKNDEAQKNYEVIVNEERLEMSFRSLQVITNFYVRTGQKEKAVALVSRYHDDNVLADMLNRLGRNVRNAKPEKTAPIVDNANIGLSEALFSIASTLRQGAAGVDLAHMFISLSVYANPKYDLAKLLLADILESREMYAEANEVYDDIDKNSEAYYTVQLKKASNFVLMEDYKSAELLLKALALDGYSNYQLYLDLGDVLRVNNKQAEAIEYYKKAVKKIDKFDNEHWVLFYALGISYEQDKQWDKAEKSFLKALELSQNHYLVLNYLGYSWLKQGKNVEQAFGMIVDAYNQAPNDGHILDSLGWAFYRLGKYEQAIEYMEKAAELEPANAVISDHLGDAYWLGGRKNEAGFQWNHVLVMKDDTGEVDYDFVRRKINGEAPKNEVPPYNEELIEEKIKEISKE